MGGSNLMHAHSNYLICMRFIRINTVLNLGKFVAHGRMNGEPYPPEMVCFFVAGLLQNVCFMQPTCPVHLVTMLCKMVFLVLPVTAPSVCRCSTNCWSRTFMESMPQLILQMYPARNWFYRRVCS